MKTQNWSYNNRCYGTCLAQIKKMNKEEKSIAKLIEGKADGTTHYWIEMNGEIIDIHYEIIDIEATEYTPKKSWNANEIQITEGEECEAKNRHGQTKIMICPDMEGI